MKLDSAVIAGSCGVGRAGCVSLRVASRTGPGTNRGLRSSATPRRVRVLEADCAAAVALAGRYHEVVDSAAAHDVAVTPQVGLAYDDDEQPAAAVKLWR